MPTPPTAKPEIADPALPLEGLLPIRALIVTLEFIGDARPGFFDRLALLWSSSREGRME